MPGVKPEVLRDLNCVTPADAIKQRPAFKGGPVLDYVDARYVYDVLDSVVGPENWQTAFMDSNIGGVRGGIGILVDQSTYDEQGAVTEPREAIWVWKWDAGIESNIEAVKGAHSGCLKRAAVQFGIARDLYDDDRETAKPEGTAAVQTVRPTVVQSGDRFTGNPSEAAAAGPWACPIHGQVKVVPGGTSAKTGKQYDAFYACTERGCNETARGIKVV